MLGKLPQQSEACKKITLYANALHQHQAFSSTLQHSLIRALHCTAGVKSLSERQHYHIPYITQKFNARDLSAM